MAVNKLYLEPDGLVVGATQLVASGGGVTVGRNLAVAGNIIANNLTILGTITTSGNITVGNILGNVSGFSLGYRDMPQVAAGNVTLTVTDGGKHYYSTSSANITITVPTFETVPLIVGTAVMIVNRAMGNVFVAPMAGVNMFLAGNTVSSTRTISPYGLASLVKVENNTWMISGVGAY